MHKRRIKNKIKLQTKNKNIKFDNDKVLKLINNGGNISNKK
jgi:hypothetical protein